MSFENNRGFLYKSKVNKIKIKNLLKVFDNFKAKSRIKSKFPDFSPQTKVRSELYEA